MLVELWLAVTGFFCFHFFGRIVLGLSEFFHSALLQHEQIQSYCHPVCWKESVKLKHKAKTVASPRRLQRHSNGGWVNEWVNRDESRLTCRCKVFPFPFHFFLLDHIFALHYHKTETNAYFLHSVQRQGSCECVTRCDKKKMQALYLKQWHCVGTAKH